MTTLHTKTGKMFDIFHPRVENLDLVDIAAGLANKCRWSGQCPFYSVAEHSVRMARHARDMGMGRDVARWCLMHDAAEFLLPDVPTPIKAAVGWYFELQDGHYDFIRFTAVEEKILDVVAVKFGLPKIVPEKVKILDRRIRGAEQREFFAVQDADGLEPLLWEERDGPLGWLPEVAQEVFLMMYSILWTPTSYQVPCSHE